MTDGYKAYVTNMEAYVNMIIENVAEAMRH